MVVFDYHTISITTTAYYAEEEEEGQEQQQQQQHRVNFLIGLETIFTFLDIL